MITNKDEQVDMARRITSMLLHRIHKDETTDFTGYNISKARVAEHAQKVVEDIERGALQPMKLPGLKFV